MARTIALAIAAAASLVQSSAVSTLRGNPTLLTLAAVDGDVFVRRDLADIDVATPSLQTDCVLGEWLAGPCDTDTLLQIFTRRATPVVARGGPCEDLVETRPCAPVHCQVSAWSAWGACDPVGYKVRTRGVDVAPLYGGRECPALVDKVRCRSADCRVTSWSPWKCDEALGTKTRSRAIVQHATKDGAPCPTTLDEQAECDPVDCELDAAYEDAWGACDADGNRHRRRKIKVAPRHGGRACPPDRETWLTQWRACEPVDCVVKTREEDSGPFGDCQLRADGWYRNRTLGVKAEPLYGGSCPPPEARLDVQKCARSCETKAGTDMWASAIASLATASPDACCQECLKRPQCQSFSFHAPYKWCFLQTAVKVPLADAEYIGGKVLATGPSA